MIDLDKELMDSEAAPKSRKAPRTLAQLNELLERKYPRLMKEGIGNAAGLLPSGQLITLWMTLHHNFYEGCIRNLQDGEEFDEEQRLFFATVADHFFQFLNVVKLADPSIPLQTTEKMGNLLFNFGAECLRGLAVSLIDRKHDEDLVHWFLMLSFVSSELQGIMLHYHRLKFRGVKPLVQPDSAATNLVYLSPYLTSEEWQQLETQVQSFGEQCCKDLFVDLVGQKLKYLCLLHRDPSDADLGTPLLDRNIKEAYHYVLSKLRERSPETWNQELYSLVSNHMTESETIELARGVVNQIPSQSFETSILPNDAKFQYALVLEITGELLSKLIKMKIMRKPFKHIRKEIFSIENRVKLLSESVYLETPQSTKILQEFTDLTNQLIQSTQEATSGVAQESVAAEYSEDLILPYLNSLSLLPLEEYSRPLTTAVFLTSLNCIVAAAELGSQTLLDIFSVILSQSSVDFVGNPFIFSVNWITFFKWFSGNSHHFSFVAKRSIARIVFQNIYVSPKAVDDFSDDFKALLNVKLTSPLAPMLLLLLEFLTTELRNQNRGKNKSKVATQIQNHTVELMQVTLKTLKKSQKKVAIGDANTLSMHNTSAFHASWLLQEAVQVISKDTESTSISLDLETISSVLKIQTDLAMNHLQEEHAGFKSESKNTTPEQSTQQLSQCYALAFLHGICTSKAFTPGFVLKLWKVYMGIQHREQDRTMSNIPILSAKDVYLASSEEEFGEITKCIETELEIQANKTSFDEMTLNMLTKIVHELLDVDLTPEKKTIRRLSVERILYINLAIIGQWSTEPTCITNVVLPFLNFQVSLLRRRNAMCSTNALSMCLVTITSVPLNEISDIALYRKAFCTVVDLLNAFTVHRLDVLSFRIHIYLQCFQTMVESITNRSDQKRDLLDEEILHLKYCAHAMERVCQSIKLGQKEFSRVSPYFIAILMRQFEMFTVYPAVKDPLLSGCYKLLDLCDDHGIAQLNSMFTPGSREIFKTVNDVYKKFYRYTGKV